MDTLRDSFSIKEFFRNCKNPFAEALISDLGFTFNSDEISLGDFPKQIQIKSRKDSVDDVKQHCEIVFGHPESGLEAEIHYVYYSDTCLLELEGRFYNRGNQIIHNVNGPFSLCIEMDIENIGTPKMTTIYGGAPCDGCFPPPAYQLTETDGLRSLIGGRESGRSTESVTPYAFITDPEENFGFFVTYEWPCRWIICAGSDHKRAKVLAHVSYTGFDLAPGESIYMPKANLGFFTGDAVAGSNALRRHIVNHVRRPIRDASMLPPVFYNHYWISYESTGCVDIEYLKEEAKVYSELGVEYFVVDAGWFKEGFRKGIGNWETDNERMFPDGMDKFADYVRSLGMKFGSWLEIEFAMKSSDWVKNHPDWFYYSKGMHDYSYGKRTLEDCLLKLDDKNVRDKVADFLEKWVDKYGIEWLRWDFNNGPRPFWDANEAENQWGRIQLEYGEGLYMLMDEFMTRCPQVHIEACAGGGHRVDMGTLRRAHSLWMSDNSNTVPAIRRFQAGVNRIQPGNYANSVLSWATHEDRCPQGLDAFKADGYPLYVLRSRMAGSLGFSERHSFLNPEMKMYLKNEIENYKQQRHLLMKDYYPLFNPEKITDYDGWQFHDPETEEGCFMVFRCQSSFKKIEVTLFALTEKTEYELLNIDTGEKTVLLGNDPISVEIPEEDGVVWYRYKKL